MDKNIEKMIEIIRQEEEKLAEFLGLLEEQKKLLVSNNDEEFERSVVLQEALIDEIQTLEKARVEFATALAAQKSQPVSEITITNLVELSLGQSSDELRDVKKNVTNLVKRIKRASQVNQYLIKRSANRIQKNIDFMLDGADMEVMYRNDGKLQGKQGKAVLVNKTL